MVQTNGDTTSQSHFIRDAKVSIYLSVCLFCARGMCRH